MGESNGTAAAMNLAGRVADRAQQSNRVPSWAKHVINTLLTIATMFFGAPLLPGGSAPAAAPVAPPAAFNADGSLTVTQEQIAAWRAAWTQRARQQVLRDIAATVRHDHSPEAVLHLVLGLAIEATGPVAGEPVGEVVP